jgi:uncharacterized protein (DUF1330 family)
MTAETSALLVIVGENIVWDNMSKGGVGYRAELDASRLYERFGARFVVARAPAEVLEGEYPSDRLTIIAEFPNRAAAEAFWFSEDYQRIKPLRDGAGDFTIGIWDSLPGSQVLPVTAQARAEKGEPAPAVMVVAAKRLVKDPYRQYLRAVRDEKLMEQVGAVALAGGPPAKLLEGDFAADQNTVVIRFPSLAAVHAFWGSPAYARVKALRAGAGDFVISVWERPAL